MFITFFARDIPAIRFEYLFDLVQFRTKNIGNSLLI